MQVFREGACTRFFWNLIVGLLFLILSLLSAVEVRKSLHLRLGLPFDRPLLRIANAVDFFARDGVRSDPTRKGNHFPLNRQLHLSVARHLFPPISPLQKEKLYFFFSFRFSFGVVTILIHSCGNIRFYFAQRCTPWDS